MKAQRTAAQVMRNAIASVSVDQMATQGDLSPASDSLLVVMDGARVAGFLDLHTVATLASNGSAQSHFAELFGNIMDVDFVTCRPEDSIAAVRSVCTQTSCRLVIVVDEELKVCGWFPSESLDP